MFLLDGTEFAPTSKAQNFLPEYYFSDFPHILFLFLFYHGVMISARQKNDKRVVFRYKICYNAIRVR